MANIVVGVTGGIAAYKSAALIRLFAESGHHVQVAATTNALRFIGETTLEALSKSKVQVVDPDLFTDVEQVKHVALAKNAHLIVIAPATASFLAKIAAGIADDLLTTTVLAASCPVVVAPAMHSEMWSNSATVENTQTLKERGIVVVEPGIGRLTGEDSGVGRLAEVEEIFSACLSLLEGPLHGKRVLVTAGGTREPIDAVRYIGNFSSGKQGIAFAKAAQLLGADVHLIAANIEPTLLTGIEHSQVSNTDELQRALVGQKDRFDVLIMAAAVSDFRSKTVHSAKINRREVGDILQLELVPNSDLLSEFTKSLGNSRSTKIILGFAAETGSDLEGLARRKLVEKDCDFVIANDVGQGNVFGSDNNSIVLVDQESATKISGTKFEVAKSVWSILASKLVKS